MKNLRFATGPDKGKLLDERGVPWKLAYVGGKQTAVFADGVAADFVVDPEPKPAAETVSVPQVAYFGNQASIAAPAPVPQGRFRRRRKPIPPVTVEPPPPVLEVDRVARFVTSSDKSGILPNPVYAVYKEKKSPEDPSVYVNYSRLEVGTGLREYLWLYEKFRELGRGRWTAMREAWELYCL